MEKTTGKKLIAKWEDTEKVGIWDNETWIVRLYSDRAVCHYPTVRWVNNSGSLDHKSGRITGTYHTALVKLENQQIEDAADYTDKVYGILKAWQEDEEYDKCCSNR